MRPATSQSALWIAPVQALLVGIIAIPAIAVFWLSLNQSSYGLNQKFVGLANYAEVLRDPYFWRATINTLAVVNAVVYVELLVGLCTAFLLASGIAFRRTVFAIMLMPYAVSEVVGVFVWKALMNYTTGPLAHFLINIGITNFNWSVSPWKALTLVSIINLWHHLPFTTILLYAGIISIPVSLYEAAHIDGASSWQTFMRVTLPLLVPTILITLIFRFIFAFRLFSEAWLLTQGGPARTTEVMAVYVYEQGFKFGNFGAASAASWLMGLAALLVASAYFYLLYRRNRQGHA